MAITASQVNELRKATGAGMMDCKKALVEADGDKEKAIELLRKKGQKISSKRADREATEGAVFAVTSGDNKNAYMIELSCETDFVARNDDFQTLGNTIIGIAQENNPSSVDELAGLNYTNGEPVQSKITEMMGVIGEKIELKEYAHLAGEQVITYIHPGARVGVLVAFDGVDGSDVTAIGKDIAMQIAAMKPIALDKESVPQDVIEKEKEIGKAQAIEEGKPADLAEKIAFGKLNKYFKENTLLEQAFVKDSSKTVAQYLKEFNPNLKVRNFKRFQLGSN